MENRGLQLYKQFRGEIDTLCFPLLKKLAGKKNYRNIIYDGKQVGFLMVINGYVSAIYVEPEYRGKGLAKQAVLDYLNKGGVMETLHIVNTNIVAQKFWNNVLELEEIEFSEVDTLYRILGRARKDSTKTV